MNSNGILNDIAEVVMGQSPKGEDVNTDGDGFPLLNGPTEFKHRYPEPVQYTTEGRKFSKDGDILFCVRGSTTGRMNYADQRYAIGRGIAAIRGKNGYPTPYVRAVIERNLDRLLVAATGSTFPNVGRDLVLNFEIETVSPEESIAINELIVSLEDKIEINRQTNQTLEDIAQAIFKSWFVDFEPTRAKIAAKQNGEDPERAAMAAISGKTITDLNNLPPEQQQSLKSTAALFPDTLTDSEFGQIPEGWKTGRVSELCSKVESGGTPSRKEPEYWNGGDIPWLTSGEVRQAIVIEANNFITLKGLQNSSAKLWSPLTTVVAMYGATAGQVTLLACETSANQACCALIPKEASALYVFFKAKNSVQEYEGKASGSAQQNLNKSIVSNLDVILPPGKVLGKFESVALPIILKMIANEKENKTLSETRDILLPKLLSGELEITKMEKAVANV